MDLVCTWCWSEFQATVWVDGKCPFCGNDFYWEEDYLDDLSDSWSVAYFDKYRSQEQKEDK